ncbi:MAG: hypothetical protein IT210_09815 [Armatimonadetes bacterium]|nr:hypothetical protein [Armatimonadota bacterium]
MSMRINTNTTSINAHNNLLQTSDSLSRSIERLSSGLKINRSADDPAGLVISENLRAQIGGVTQAMANANDAVNLVKTAEGALSEVHSLLRTMRTLAQHAANTGVNDLTAIQADQTQIKSAIDSINRIAQQTQFGTKKLLDGTSGISATVTKTSDVAALFIGGQVGGNTITTAGAITLTVTQAATRSTYVASRAFGSGATTAMGTGGTVVVNGQSVSVQASDTAQTLINKINDISSITGVTAKLDSSNHLELTSINYGSNFKIAVTESADGIINTTASTPTSNTDGVDALATAVIGSTTVQFTGGVGANDSGLKMKDASGNSILLTETGNTAAVTAEATAGTAQTSALAADEVLTFSGNLFGGTSVSLDLTTGDTQADIIDAINSNDLLKEKIVASADSSGNLVITSKEAGLAGNFSVVSDVAAAADSTGIGTTPIAGGGSGGNNTVGSVSAGSLSFAIGANANQSEKLSLGNVQAYQLGNTVVASMTLATVDVTTATGANDAIKIIDEAISQVSGLRANLGAFQKQTLESNMRSLGIAKENLSASESAVRDTDMAAEMVSFTRSQILMQAGTAMLAQANSMPQQVLQLLRG